MTQIIFLAFSLVLISPIPSGYRGIVPLRSTSRDVERVFGKPSKNGAYYFRDEIVIVEYAKYGCKSAPAVAGWPTRPPDGWNVSPDTVLSVRVNLRKQVPLENLGIDVSKFKKVRGDRDVATHFRYVDEESGLIIDLNGEGAEEIVSGYVYVPEAKYKYLRCKD